MGSVLKSCRSKNERAHTSGGQRCCWEHWFGANKDQPLKTPILLDCTLRDGGYYNAWDFEPKLIQEYLNAMQSAGVDCVEFGFRSTVKNSFMGGCAYSTDEFIGEFDIPPGMKLSVMVNAAEFLDADKKIDEGVLSRLFAHASESRVSLVRLATHFRDLDRVLPVTHWLGEAGYSVAMNIMQVEDRSEEELEVAGFSAEKYPLDVLYFADSLGSMDPERTKSVVRTLRRGWQGSLGIHAHDNMARALVNSVAAVEEGAQWVDGTLTGMGRGPGNAKTELLVLELEHLRGANRNLTDLFSLVRRQFQPMQREYGWGVNPYYYLAGKYGIHPTFVQNMLGDARYESEDVLSVIEHLRVQGGKSFNAESLANAQAYYTESPGGSWSPRELFAARDVLIVGNGPGTGRYRDAIERFIQNKQPVVVALNAEHQISNEIVDVRIACHPLRLLADCEKYRSYPQPLITPVSQLPQDVLDNLKTVTLLDYGITVNADRFEFNKYYAVVPKPLVFVYSLAAASSGGANKIMLAGFDGYSPGDPRNDEMDELVDLFFATEHVPDLVAITPSRYKVPCTSVYAISDSS